MVEDVARRRAGGASGLADAVADQVLGWNPVTYDMSLADDVLKGAFGPEDDHRSSVAELRDKALELAGRRPALPLPDLEGPVSRDDGYGLAVIGWLGVVEDWLAGVRALPCGPRLT